MGSDSESEEEHRVDWSKFAPAPGPSRTQAVIPKRGLKDFQPAAQDSKYNASDVQILTEHQMSQLETSRAAYVVALGAGGRSHGARMHNVFVWDPELQVAYWPTDGAPHGIHFQTMGHYNSARRRIELFPEEALYLLERGATELVVHRNGHALPLSVQGGYVMLLGDDVTLEQFFVYAHLRRLGYTVLRESHVHYIWGVQKSVERRRPVSTWRDSVWRLLSWPVLTLGNSVWRLLSWPVSVCGRLGAVFVNKGRTFPSVGAPRILSGRKTQVMHSLTNAESPTRVAVQGLLFSRRLASYDEIFRRLQIVQAVDPGEDPIQASPSSKYRSVWAAYKPANHFPKTQPPAPDFHVSVVSVDEDLPSVEDLRGIVHFQDTAPQRAAPRPVGKRKSEQMSRQYEHPPPLSLVVRFKSWLGLLPYDALEVVRRPSPSAKILTAPYVGVLAVVEGSGVSFNRVLQTGLGGYTGI